MFQNQGRLTVHIKSAPIFFSLHYITTYSAYFNSLNNNARNLFSFEQKSREKPGRYSLPTSTLYCAEPCFKVRMVLHGVQNLTCLNFGAHCHQLLNSYMISCFNELINVYYLEFSHYMGIIL